MNRSWTRFLDAAPSTEHAVQIYRDETELADTLCVYLTRGLAAGDPAVVIATADHWARAAEALAREGVNPEALQQQGLLTIADADETLAKFMEGDTPSARRFEQVVGELLDSISARHPGRRIRAFGDMVDLLCLRSQTEAAIALEELWNDLLPTRPFSLLCGYSLDVFDRASQVAPLPGICRTHSHVLPARNGERLTLAVDSALEEILGPGEADKIYLLVDDDARRQHIPGAQLALMWVSTHMPVSADRILAAARAHYHRPAPAPSV